MKAADFDAKFPTWEGGCIWCCQPTSSPDREHIIPESMGGPWTLPGNVVCKHCNKKLSHLDRSIADPFDVLTFMMNILGKDGKTKKVASRGNLIAEHTADGPVLRVNSSRKDGVNMPDGRRLSASGRSPRNVSSTIERLPGGIANIHFSAPLVFDRIATRALHKIALEIATYWLGPELTSDARFDPIRDYVLLDKGDREALMLADDDDKEYRHEMGQPTIEANGNCAVSFRVAVLRFLVDLSPTRALMAHWANAHGGARSGEGWRLLPYS
jgi:hypothetical protein